MNDLNMAYQILESINDNDSKNTIYKKAKLAFETSNDCLEALIIMSKCEDDIEVKERLLKDGIKNAEHLTNNSNYLRLLFELAKLYADYGKNQLAITNFEKLNILDTNNEYHSHFHLATIYALMEDNRIENLIKEDCKEVKLLLPYLVYKYKQCDYLKTKELYRKIIELNPYFKTVLKGDVKDGQVNPDKELSLALKVLSFNSLLINTCPGLISFVTKIDI